MTDPRELEEKFWKALEGDRTMLLGLDGQEDGHARPMTALSEGRRSPIWFFTSADNALVRQFLDGQPDGPIAFDAPKRAYGQEAA